jgi:ubiquinone/menaquinone biosynthesis C-methylase UbiE
VLLVSAVAVLLAGVAATALVLSQVQPAAALLRLPAFWTWLILACLLTLLSLGLRTLRWIFLLRRSEVRIPLRDASIGYLAGLSLLLAPILLGEIAVRAYVHRRRGGVPLGTIAVLNLWERLLDVMALSSIAILTGVLTGTAGLGTAGLFGAVVAAMAPQVRRGCLSVMASAVGRLMRLVGHDERPATGRLASTRAFLPAFVTSVAAWLLPGIAWWGLAGAWDRPYGLANAELAYASSTLAGGVVLAPGGIVVTGPRLLAELSRAGLIETAAVLSVIAIRLATAGVSTALGVVFLLVHVGSRPNRASHFDEIADAYDVQIPQARREALVVRKAELMRELLAVQRVGSRGLDVGCGQGWYVARMRELGFDVTGIDASPGQVRLAAEHVGDPGLIQIGSALHIPAMDAAYDFVYTINVLHHLGSIDEQRAAFVELARVLRPGGLLFVHEINTRNVLFRFYMGYVFPSLNCIDEGVERWILPTRLGRYTDLPVTDIRYFTFLPDFLPAVFVRLLAPLERWLERSRLRVFSAHYMAALRKPS